MLTIKAEESWMHFGETALASLCAEANREASVVLDLGAGRTWQLPAEEALRRAVGVVHLHVAGIGRGGEPGLDVTSREALRDASDGVSVIVWEPEEYDAGGWPVGPSWPRMNTLAKAREDWL